MNKSTVPSNVRTFSYGEYMTFVENLVQNGQTSGPLQSESLVNYTKLNLKRMQRLNKTVKVDHNLIASVNALPHATKWLAITEAWCGDAAQNLPYIAALAGAIPGLEFDLVMRDEHPELIDQFLTNGTRSIPKLIIYHGDTGQVLSTWGSRPAEVQLLVQEYKNQVGEKVPFDLFAEKVHAWYTANKNAALSTELLATFNELQNPVIV